jgi:hypothetical protein
VHVQVQEVEVPERLCHPHPARRTLARTIHVESELLDHLLRAGVRRKEDRNLAGNRGERLQDPLERGAIVDVRRAVQCQGRVPAAFQAQRVNEPETSRHVAVLEERVDHHIPDEEHLVVRHTFRAQILVREVVGREQIIAEHIRAEAVDLFGHPHVARSQSGLDVRHANAKLLCGDRARHRGVHVADHDHEIGMLAQAHLLELHHDAGRLFGV